VGWEDPLEKEMGMHSSILAWKIPWTGELGRWKYLTTYTENQSVRNKPLLLRQLTEYVKYHSGNSIREMETLKRQKQTTPVLESIKKKHQLNSGEI